MIHENWYTGSRYIFCSNVQNKVNLNLKFWDYNEKNMVFHLKHKRVLLRQALRDGNAIRTSYFNYSLSTMHRSHCTLVHSPIWTVCV